jgi:hypothetical protein
MDADIGCTAKYLPSDLTVYAAQTAVAQNPMNRPANETVGVTGIILPVEHLAVLTSRYWGANGIRLTVGFMEAIQNDLKNRIVAHFNAWSQFANVSFVLTDTDPQVRVTRNQEGYWSFLGTDILHIPKNEPTMCLQAFTMQTPESEFRRVVRHEIGHTLGFPHEHMRSAIINRIDPEKAIAYFRRTQGWSRPMVMQQVLTPLAESSLMGTPDADETSIMAYNLPGIITKDGRPIIGGDDIAPQDAEFIGKIYPKQTAPPQPPVPTAGKGLELSADFEKKTVFIRLPAGWTAQKYSDLGEIEMNPQFSALAGELEACIPAAQADAEAAKASSLGGVVGAVLSLVAALKTGDMNAIIKSFRDLLNALLGEDKEEVIGFSTKAAALRIDWSKLLGVLAKLLPLILGA